MDIISEEWAVLQGVAAYMLTLPAMSTPAPFVIQNRITLLTGYENQTLSFLKKRTHVRNSVALPDPPVVSRNVRKEAVTASIAKQESRRVTAKSLRALREIVFELAHYHA
jgi:hypothetical protein